MSGSIVRSLTDMVSQSGFKKTPTFVDYMREAQHEKQNHVAIGGYEIDIEEVKTYFRTNHPTVDVGKILREGSLLTIMLPLDVNLTQADTNAIMAMRKSDTINSSILSSWSTQTGSQATNGTSQANQQAQAGSQAA